MLTVPVSQGTKSGRRRKTKAQKALKAQQAQQAQEMAYYGGAGGGGGPPPPLFYGQGGPGYRGPPPHHPGAYPPSMYHGGGPPGSEMYDMYGHQQAMHHQGGYQEGGMNQYGQEYYDQSGQMYEYPQNGHPGMAPGQAPVDGGLNPRPHINPKFIPPETSAPAREEPTKILRNPYPSAAEEQAKGQKPDDVYDPSFPTLSVTTGSSSSAQQSNTYPNYGSNQNQMQQQQQQPMHMQAPASIPPHHQQQQQQHAGMYAHHMAPAPVVTPAINPQPAPVAPSPMYRPPVSNSLPTPSANSASLQTGTGHTNTGHLPMFENRNSTSINYAQPQQGFPSFQQNKEEKPEPKSKVQVMTGVVTQMTPGAFGMISEEIFFQESCVTGPIPKFGDKVVVEAEPVNGMPFKYNAKKVTKLDMDLVREEKSTPTPPANFNQPQPQPSGQRMETFERPQHLAPLPAMPESLNLPRPANLPMSSLSSAMTPAEPPQLKSILKKRNPPPPPVISKPASSTIYDITSSGASSFNFKPTSFSVDLNKDVPRVFPAGGTGPPIEFPEYTYVREKDNAVNTLRSQPQPLPRDCGSPRITRLLPASPVVEFNRSQAPPATRRSMRSPSPPLRRNEFELQYSNRRVEHESMAVDRSPPRITTNRSGESSSPKRISSRYVSPSPTRRRRSISRSRSRSPKKVSRRSRSRSSSPKRRRPQSRSPSPRSRRRSRSTSPRSRRRSRSTSPRSRRRSRSTSPRSRRRSRSVTPKSRRRSRSTTPRNRRRSRSVTPKSRRRSSRSTSRSRGDRRRSTSRSRHSHRATSKSPSRRQRHSRSNSSSIKSISPPSHRMKEVMTHGIKVTIGKSDAFPPKYAERDDDVIFTRAHPANQPAPNSTKSTPVPIKFQISNPNSGTGKPAAMVPNPTFKTNTFAMASTMLQNPAFNITKTVTNPNAAGLKRKKSKEQEPAFKIVDEAKSHPGPQSKEVEDRIKQWKVEFTALKSKVLTELSSGPLPKHPVDPGNLKQTIHNDRHELLSKEKADPVKKLLEDPNRIQHLKQTVEKDLQELRNKGNPSDPKKLLRSPEIKELKQTVEKELEELRNRGKPPPPKPDQLLRSPGNIQQIKHSVQQGLKDLRTKFDTNKTTQSEKADLKAVPVPSTKPASSSSSKATSEPPKEKPVAKETANNTKQIPPRTTENVDRSRKRPSPTRSPPPPVDDYNPEIERLQEEIHRQRYMEQESRLRELGDQAGLQQLFYMEDRRRRRLEERQLSRIRMREIQLKKDKNFGELARLREEWGPPAQRLEAEKELRQVRQQEERNESQLAGQAEAIRQQEANYDKWLEDEAQARSRELAAAERASRGTEGRVKRRRTPSPSANPHHQQQYPPKPMPHNRRRRSRSVSFERYRDIRRAQRRRSPDMNYEQFVMAREQGMPMPHDMPPDAFYHHPDHGGPPPGHFERDGFFMGAMDDVSRRQDEIMHREMEIQRRMEMAEMRHHHFPGPGPGRHPGPEPDHEFHHRDRGEDYGRFVVRRR